jgi:DNA-binding IclR family transcriptional regulator
MSSYKRIETVKKTTEVLEYLAGIKDAATGPQIAQGVGMQLGTVMCHLATLEDAGFVVSAGGGYRLGMKLALMWARVKSNMEGQRNRIDRDLEAISIEGVN